MDELEKKLEVVDENDIVVGIEPRSKVHRDGLLDREIHIFFITPKGEIIFQHRAKDKDTYPDKLDATVGGHVEPGMSYEETAIKECKEETGVDVTFGKLIFLAKFRKKSFDKATGKINNIIRAQYAYFYDCLISDLQIEEGKSEGFEAWKIEDLINISESDKERFIQVFISDDMIKLYNKAKDIFLK